MTVAVQSAYLPVFAAALLTGIVAYVLAHGRSAAAELPQRVNTSDLASARQTPDVAPGRSGSSLTERTAITFAKQVISGISTDDLTGVIESQLSLLLSGRRVWIVVTAHQSANGEPRGAARRPTPLLNESVQEWTTFLVQSGGTRFGVLGIESPGGLPADAKEMVQRLIPVIAQAVRTAQEVEMLREASVVDLLTGAATRREGLRRLQAEVKRAQRAGHSMAILMMDLDHFKSINDQFGHGVGDALLTAIGQTLVRTLRASDLRCRWGGEEFLIVLPETSLAQAQVVATNLLHSVAATTTPSAKGPVSSTASIGLTISRPAETDVDRIVERADLALYQAKHAGRACIRVLLGGLDGEPVGGLSGRRLEGTTDVARPFSDRRDLGAPDRRADQDPGRQSADVAAAPEAAWIRDRRRVGG